MRNAVFGDKNREKAVSGRYRSSGNLSLELRVDLDGYRPMNKISGDFFTNREKDSYIGSFISDITKKLKINSTAIILEGKCNSSWNTSFSKIQVKIQNKTTSRKAIVQFLSEEDTLSVNYICDFESKYFRTVQYEQDVEEGVKPFESYDTSFLKGGGPDRKLSVETAFAEAGIEIQRMPSNIIDSHKEWDDEELENLMKKHFNLLKDEPQWKVWLFAANKQERGSGRRGTMLNGKKPRQGCAVFHNVISGSKPTVLREQLWTYMHELGHCFNLLHSHLRANNDTNSLYTLSWMTFPHYYPGGSSEYWKKFTFQFDVEEIIHLRHGFRNDVILGGNNFKGF